MEDKNSFNDWFSLEKTPVEKQQEDLENMESNEEKEEEHVLPHKAMLGML